MRGFRDAIPARETRLEGIPVQRLLPRSRRRLVGPWCFADVYGPLELGALRMDVPPHPHIGIQTVSWLFDGELLHKDSLGAQAVARPGVLNLMTSGCGIAHSEESPITASGTLYGAQLWVALPADEADTAPSFEQHAALPRVEWSRSSATVFMGELEGARSPARAFSPLVAFDAAVDPGVTARLPLEPSFEHAVLLVRGSAEVEGEPLERGILYVALPGAVALRAAAGAEGARLLVFGGAPLDHAPLMWWNFVARTSDEIRSARDDWEAGRRFGEVRAYAGGRLAAPPYVARPVPPNPAS